MKDWLGDQKLKLLAAVKRRSEVEDDNAPDQNEAEAEDSDDEEEQVLTRPTLQNLRVGSINLEIEAGTSVVISPVKPYMGKKKVMWTDAMKVQVLKMFMYQADDPLKRPDPSQPKSKAIYKAQISEEGSIYNGSIRYKGQKMSLNTICKPDTLHQFFVFKGLSGQKDWGHGEGLVRIIDYTMEKHNVERTRANMMDLEWDILNLATELSNDY
jgi:hypothetical protein